MAATRSAEPHRTRYPAHEVRHPWLSALLDAYHISDTAAREELARETARRAAPPACGPGCSVCCEGQVIPVSVFEVLGLWWYVAEMLKGRARHGVRKNLLERGAEDTRPTPVACPFLVRRSCAVYPVRPFICRQHHVFGRPCQPGENLRQARPGDIFNTAQDRARDMAWLLLPLYGVAQDDIDRRFERGYVQGRSRDLHSLPLANLVTHMDAAAKRKTDNHA
ncbi:Putative zinc- or iron-chelating domain-containing protein [Humidesulfovibrio mexicanus]|uniref:Putative zinc- or iron-chelating domain-containing protein n=1 Tax=Humidesulfovibrio mexicanus TaxID=147047 RepID=A0A238YTA8_9BACT|nr:YkgJ family cysteine cluster protein [Humidesulfovibrio mexicanus]SNR74172.1 Putative zinc- or iron-chelating domain-containing protein [Humidesulfovibrio mexicanus]